MRFWKDKDASPRLSDLNDFPILLGLASALRSLLTGNVDTLSKVFVVSYLKTDDVYRMELIPKNAVIQQKIVYLVVRFDDRVVRSITIKTNSADIFEITMQP